MNSSVVRANKSFRGGKMWSDNALVPRLLSDTAQGFGTHLLGLDILDYGCGRGMPHVHKLRAMGMRVDGLDFGGNLGPQMEQVLKYDNYDLIYASNVLNTWDSIWMFDAYLWDIYCALKDSGLFICNYPQKPRYSPEIGIPELTTRLKKIYNNPRLHYNDNVQFLKKYNVFVCIKGNGLLNYVR